MISPVFFWKQRRYTICVLAFFGFSVQFLMRVNLSVAILAMTHEKNAHKIIDDIEFDWTQEEITNLLGSFFYGYILTQFVGGYIADRFGGKPVLLGSVVISSFCTLLTPVFSRWGVNALLVLRIFLGFAQGVIYPCVYPTIRKWAPQWERSLMCLIVFTGGYVGTIVAMSSSGRICQTIGWEWVFYLNGICGLIWCIPWIFCVSESPLTDKRITKQELLILQEALNTLTRDYDPKIPWKKLFRSVPVWAIAAADFGNSFGVYLVLTQFPVYLSDMHFSHEKLETIGLLSSIPHAIMIVTSLLSGYFADSFIKNEYMTITGVRKVFTCGAFILQAITSIAAACTANPTISIVCITLNVSVGAIGWAGYSVNHLDICPQYAGISMGLANTFGTLPGILMTFLVNYVVHGNLVNITTGWRIMFLITTAFCILGFIVYALCASGDREPWSMNIYGHRSSKSIESDVITESSEDNEMGNVTKSGENVVLYLRSSNKKDIEDNENK